MRLAALTLVLALGAAPLSAQSRVRADVDTTLVTVGDRITMTVSVEHPLGASVTWPDSLDLSPFEVLEARLLPARVDGDVARSSAVLTLAAFELGELEIPGLSVTVSGPGDATEVLTTNPFGIEVLSVGVDESGDIRDIRGPLGIPLGALRVASWGLLLILLAGVTHALYRRARRGHEDSVSSPAAPPRPPHEVALEALAALEASPLLGRGQIKEYHIEVSDILRTYVERRFGVDALEMTTREVIVGLERSDVDAEFREGLRRFLEPCDLVKFAKVRPSAEASREVLALGRRLVEESAPASAASAGGEEPVVEGERSVAAEVP